MRRSSVGDSRGIHHRSRWRAVETIPPRRAPSPAAAVDQERT